MPYFTGLLEGFRGRQEEELKRTEAEDLQRRELENKLYTALDQSNDPKLRALAFSGALENAQPGKRKKGLAGYLGEIQGGSIYPQVLARMQELVPASEEPGGAPPSPSNGGGGPTPPQPGSAAMSPNQPVRPGSAPIQLPGVTLPPEAPPSEAAEPSSPVGVGGGPPTGVSPAVAVGAPPPSPAAAQIAAPPPTPQLVQRGTGIPTAEMIANANTQRRIQEEQKLTEARAMEPLYEYRAATTPEEKAFVAAKYGIRPPPPDYEKQEDVKLPDGTTVPAVRDKHTGRLLNGITLQPLPEGTQAIPKTVANPLDKLLTPTEAANLNVPIGTTIRQAQGMKGHTPQDRVRLAAIQSVIPQVARLEAALSQVLPTQGAQSGLAGRVHNSLAVAKQQMQGNVQFRQLQGLLSVMRTPIAQVIARDPARVSVQEQTRVQQMLPDIELHNGMIPGLTDNPEAARGMVTQLRAEVDTALVSMGEPPVNWDALPAPNLNGPAAGGPVKADTVRLIHGQWMHIDEVFPDGTVNATPLPSMPRSNTIGTGYQKPSPAVWMPQVGTEPPSMMAAH